MISYFEINLFLNSSPSEKKLSLVCRKSHFNKHNVSPAKMQHHITGDVIQCSVIINCIFNIIFNLH